MSKKTPLSTVVGRIQFNKSRTVPKENEFLRPEPAPQPLPQDQKVTYPSGEKITQDEICTEDRITPSDTKITEDVQSTRDQNEPQGEELSKGINQTQDEKGISPQTRLTPEQKLALTLEKLKKGYTRIPNSILIEILYGDLSKAEIKILLLIARYTLSFNERKTASLSKADIERYTKLQGKSVLEALGSLVEKNLILKIKGDQYSANQLGLIYDHEILLPPDQKIITPSGEKSTSPEGTKGTHTAGQKSTHFKESFSNDLSLSCKFPNDMIARWRDFEQSGRLPNSKKEKKIFQNLFIAHGEEFFENCGRVITFLEKRGTGKEGDENIIHSPMDWINGHWETNFKRYQEWTTEEAQKEEKENQRESQEREAEELRLKEKREREKSQAQLDLNIRRFLAAYPTESEANAFIEKAVHQSECKHTYASWKRQGWESPIVKTCVISQFLASEARTGQTMEVQA